MKGRRRKSEFTVDQLPFRNRPRVPVFTRPVVRGEDAIRLVFQEAEKRRVRGLKF